MGKFTKIPEDTFKELQLEAGILLKTFDPSTAAEPDTSDIICATTGGISASCTTNYQDAGAEIDNCPENTMELKKSISHDCRMSFTAKNISAEVIRLALGGADVSDGKIVPRRYLKTTDFSDIWWVGDRADGGMAAICLKNALSTGGFSLQTTKNGSGQLSVELSGHVSINAQEDVPMEFYVTEGDA